MGKLYQIKKQNGFGLIEVLVSVGVMSIVGLGTAILISNLNSETDFLRDKLMTNEINMALNNALVSPEFCSCLLNGRGFDSTPGSESLLSAYKINRIPLGYSTSTPPCTEIGGDLVPTVGSSLPSSNLDVASIELINIVLMSPTHYTANISVQFSGSKRMIKPTLTPINFNIDISSGSTTNRPITTCGTSTSSIQAGTVNVPPLGGNAGCVAVTFPVPFPNTNYSLSVLPFSADYGSGNGQISTAFSGKTTTGFLACFDHNGSSFTNPFTADWIAMPR